MATRKRDRIFALFFAVLFLVTASTVTIAVIWQAVSNKNSTANSSQTASCFDNKTEPVSTVPTAFVTTDPVTTLKTTDLSVGTGVTAKSGDCLIVKYYGTLANNGTKFDENFTAPTGLAFTLGQQQVISGWDQGLVGMKVGGERLLVIPASLAYGSTGSCKTTNASDANKCDVYAIPPNADLVFDVKLLRIQ